MLRKRMVFWKETLYFGGGDEGTSAGDEGGNEAPQMPDYGSDNEPSDGASSTTSE